MLAPFWGPLGGNLGPIWGAFGAHFEVIFGIQYFLETGHPGGQNGPLDKNTFFTPARGKTYMSVFLEEYEGGRVRIRFGVMRAAQQGLWFEHQDPKK